MDDPSRRTTLGAYGSFRIKTQLAWDYSIPKLLDVYRTVLPSSAAKRAIPEKAEIALHRPLASLPGTASSRSND
jgi:hypothetical protein